MVLLLDQNITFEGESSDYIRHGPVYRSISVSAYENLWIVGCIHS